MTLSLSLCMCLPSPKALTPRSKHQRQWLRASQDGMNSEGGCPENRAGYQQHSYLVKRLRPGEKGHGSVTFCCDPLHPWQGDSSGTCTNTAHCSSNGHKPVPGLGLLPPQEQSSQMTAFCKVPRLGQGGILNSQKPLPTSRACWWPGWAS